MLLLWLAVALGALQTLATFTLTAMPSLPLLLLAALGVLVLAVLIGKIGEGRGWARVVLIALFGLGLVQLLADAAPLLSNAPPLFMLGLMQRALEALAIYLIFTPPGSSWYRAAP
jgi:hypothetical protein